jgi:hypothetical protein
LIVTDELALFESADVIGPHLSVTDVGGVAPISIAVTDAEYADDVTVFVGMFGNILIPKLFISLSDTPDGLA